MTKWEFQYYTYLQLVMTNYFISEKVPANFHDLRDLKNKAELFQLRCGLYKLYCVRNKGIGHHQW